MTSASLWRADRLTASCRSASIETHESAAGTSRRRLEQLWIAWFVSALSLAIHSHPLETFAHSREWGCFYRPANFWSPPHPCKSYPSRPSHFYKPCRRLVSDCNWCCHARPKSPHHYPQGTPSTPSLKSDLRTASRFLVHKMLSYSSRHGLGFLTLCIYEILLQASLRLCYWLLRCKLKIYRILRIAHLNRFDRGSYPVFTS